MKQPEDALSVSIFDPMQMKEFKTTIIIDPRFKETWDNIPKNCNFTGKEFAQHFFKAGYVAGEKDMYELLTTKIEVQE